MKPVDGSVCVLNDVTRRFRFHRSGTYQQAILSNKEDFRDKVVLDVGTGTGILAFFAIQVHRKNGPLPDR